MAQSEDDSRKGAKVAKFGEKNTFFARLASWREKSLRGEGDHSYIDLRFAHLVETLALFDELSHEIFKATLETPSLCKHDSIWHVACIIVTHTTEKEDHR